jgi:hypothetical protein
LRANQVLSEEQHGFTEKKSCVTNLLEALESWTTAVDEGNNVDIIFLDYSKAFDTVPHRRLLDKLKSYGIRGPIHGWIQDFLSERTQRVRIKSTNSLSQPVHSGVPQGSVLGPLLFILYVNDLPASTNSPSKFFADDAKMYKTVNNIRNHIDFQQDLDGVENWSVVWQMGFNLDKCKHMRLGKIPIANPYHLKDKKGENHQIKITTSEKDLGVTIDSNLEFTEHIEIVAKKANQIMGTIRRNFSELNKTTFNLLYKSLVRPHMEYAQEVWSPRWKKDQDKLEKVQRRATKLVMGLRQLPYEQRLRELNLPTLKHRRLRGDLITMYKITHGQTLTSLEIPYSENLNLRGHPLKLAPIRTRGQTRSHFYTNRIVKPWNSLPAQVVMAPSLNVFKSSLDRYWKGTNHNIYEYKW